MQSYTTAQRDAINAVNGVRYVKWGFVIGSKDPTTGAFVAKTNAGGGDITPWVSSATITHDTQQQVHRTCSLHMAETAASQTLSTTNSGTEADAGIDYLNDLLQVTCYISPDNVTWYNWKVFTGLFRRAGVTMAGHSVVRNAELVDLTQVVQQQQSVTSADTGTALVLPGGYYIIDVIQKLLTNAPTLVQPSEPTLLTLSNLPGCGIPSAWLGSWPTSATLDAKIPSNGYPVSEGEDYLSLINKLLYYISCYDLWCDESGQYQVTRWPANQDYVANAPSTWTYDSTSNSIIAVGGTEEILLDDLANSVCVVVEDPSRTPVYASAEVTNVNSPIYKTNWGKNFYGTSTGRVVTKVIRDMGVPDATATNWLQNYVNQQLNQAGWLVDQVTLPTAVNPVHQDHDVVTLNIYQTTIAGGSVNNWPIIGTTSTPTVSTPYPIPGLTTTQKFLELGWSIDIQLPSPGAGQNIAGGVGMTTLLEPRDQKQGHQMSHTLSRVTAWK